MLHEDPQLGHRSYLAWCVMHLVHILLVNPSLINKAATTHSRMCNCKAIYGRQQSSEIHYQSQHIHMYVGKQITLNVYLAKRPAYESRLKLKILIAFQIVSPTLFFFIHAPLLSSSGSILLRSSPSITHSSSATSRLPYR